MTWMEWYNTLSKPEWTPSPGTISLIWQILYPIILISFGSVFYQTARRRYPATTAVPFAINLIANLSFTPLFFGLRNVPLATLDILVVWVYNPLDNLLDLASLPLGRVGSDPLSDLGFHRYDDPGQYFLDELRSLEVWC